MIKVKTVFYVFLLLLSTKITFAQDQTWNKDEKQFYKTMKSLCEHFKGKAYDTTQRSFVFKKFVKFDHLLTDTSANRLKDRINFFDYLFYKMTHYVDSVGFENLDAKPTRFFKHHQTFFKPYDKGGELNELLPITLAYFDKRKPDEPIGTLLFDPESHKLLAWLILNQGGNYRYFLTFNLL